MRKRILYILLALCLMLSACNTKPKENVSEKEIAENIEVKETEVVKEEAEEEEVEIDEASGLKKEGELELKYANSFSVDFLENGVKKYTDIEGRIVYLVPKDVELDKKDIEKISIPVENIAIFSTVDATLLRPIDKLDLIVATTTAAESWRIPEVKERIENGEITYLGSKSALNYEELQKVNPEIILFTYENLERTPILIQAFEDLNMNWLGLSNHMESDPRARIEWVKLAGIITDELDKANEYYEEQIKKIDVIEEKTANEDGEKPTFVWTFLFKDLFYTKRPGDYSTKIMELAGGEALYTESDGEITGNAKLNAEEFYKIAEEADFLIYDNIGGAEIQSVDDLINYAEYMKDLKAVKNNNVWGLRPQYFQSADYTADMIEEFYEIIHAEPGTLTETEYFFNLGNK